MFICKLSVWVFFEPTLTNSIHVDHAIYHCTKCTNRIIAMILFAKQQTNLPMTLIFAFNFQQFVYAYWDEEPSGHRNAFAARYIFLATVNYGLASVWVWFHFVVCHTSCGHRPASICKLFTLHFQLSSKAYTHTYVYMNYCSWIVNGSMRYWLAEWQKMRGWIKCEN